MQTVEVRLSGGILDCSTLPCGLAVPCVAGTPYPTDPNELVRTPIVLPEPSTALLPSIDCPNFFYGLAFREGAGNQICSSK